jgi:hypothetical protein
VRTVALLSLLLVTAGAAPRGPATRTQATQPPSPRFRTGVDVVEVAVLVKDREGKPVTDLARNEITVLENGAPQTLLLFSEGVDYDQADVLGKVQRNASDVMRGMGRAIGALMRTNVALYAVDPRALNSPEADLLETPLYYARGRDQWCDTGTLGPRIGRACRVCAWQYG